MIRPNVSVTLWSDSNATLDAEGAGRHFTVRASSPHALLMLMRTLCKWQVIGQLRLQGLHLLAGYPGAGSGSRSGGCLHGHERLKTLIMRETVLSNCMATGAQGPVQGGGVSVAGGVVEVTDCTFMDCKVSGSGGASGGGIGVSGDGDVTIERVRFERTHAIGDLPTVFGGGVSMFDGRLTMKDVEMLEVSAISANGWAFGGGLGMQGGEATVSTTTFVQTAATSLSAQNGARAFGGSLGMNNAGMVTVYDSSMARCNATVRNGLPASIAAGGSIGAIGWARVGLFNVTLANSRASTSALGSALFVRPETLTAANLTIHDECAPDDTSTRLVGTDREGGLLLRGLVIVAPNCLATLADGTHLFRCNDAPGIGACGPKTVCTDSGDAISTPMCVCEPSDPTQPFVQPIPSMGARRPELAPYLLEQGCVNPPVAEKRLRRNWWRATANTTDARACINFWEEGDPTPCRGNLGNLGQRPVDDYCERGLTGPRCRVCLEAGHFYDESSASCMACPDAPLAISIGVTLAVGAALWLLLVLWRCRHALCYAAWLEQAVTIMPRLGLVGKLKLALGYLQVVSVMPEAFSVPLPLSYFRWMRYLQWLDLDWFLLGAPAPACFGDFGQRLRLKAFAPLVLLVCVVAISFAVTLVEDWSLLFEHERQQPRAHLILATAKHGLARVLPFTLFSLSLRS